MVNRLKLINVNSNDYIYNTITGLLYECDEKILNCIYNDKIDKNLDNALRANLFYEETSYKLYPIITSYCIWNEWELIYNNIDLELNIRKITLQENIFLSKIDGKTMLSDILIENCIKYNDVKELIDFLLSVDIQAIKFLNYKCNLDKSQDLFIYKNKKLIQHSESNFVHNVEYYSTLKKENAVLQFENIETTISYLFRKKNDITFNKTYGELIIDILNSNKSISNILEVGAGLGDIAYSILNSYESDVINYTVLDLSQALLEYQKDKLNLFNLKYHQIKYIHCNAENFNESNTYDLILCNEVIADLTCQKFSLFKTTDEYKNLPSHFFKNYKYHDYVNVGAIRILYNIYNALNENGIAFITEYSENNGKCEISNIMSDHKEISIDFELLNSIAKHIGFQVNLEPLMKFMKLKDCKVLSPISFDLLSFKYNLDKQFYSEFAIEKINFDKFKNLNYVNLSCYMKFFYALLLTKKEVIL